MFSCENGVNKLLYTTIAFALYESDCDRAFVVKYHTGMKEPIRLSQDQTIASLKAEKRTHTFRLIGANISILLVLSMINLIHQVFEGRRERQDGRND